MRWVNVKSLKRIHEDGMLRFVIFHGMFYAGMLGAAVYTLILAFRGQACIGKYDLITISLFPFMGILWGVCMWFFYEKLYEKYVADRR